MKRIFKSMVFRLQTDKNLRIRVEGMMEMVNLVHKVITNEEINYVYDLYDDLDVEIFR